MIFCVHFLLPMKSSMPYLLPFFCQEIYVSGYHFPTIVDNIYLSKEPAELFQNADLNVDVVVTGVTKDEGVTFGKIVRRQVCV